jgi:TPR repeat protein
MAKIWLQSPALVLSAALLSASALAQQSEPADELEAVQLYTDEALVSMFEDNRHLRQVEQIDRCQLVMDIEAQAELEQRPTYQFLYGDMLAWGVCYERDVELGLHYMRVAADQGLIQALEQLGRYYHTGTIVQQDTERAIRYLREAASLGNLAAQKRFADIMLAGNGSPYDFTHAYHWLHHAETGDREEHQRIQQKLEQLGKLMPPSAVEKAREKLL